MFDALTTQKDVTRLLMEMGQLVTLIKASGSKYKAYGIWGRTESADAGVLNTTQIENKVLFLSGAVTKPPESGDTIEFGKRNWGVLKVDAYKPAAIVIAYKVTMMG